MTPTVLLGLALAAAAPAPKEAPKKDPPSLVGEWAVESAIHGGKPEKKSGPASITFTADGKLQVREGKDAKPEELPYSHNPKKDPPEIDLTEPRGGMMGGEVMKGIYRIDGDTLLLCLSIEGERPTTFDSPAGSNRILVTLRRAKKE